MSDSWYYAAQGQQNGPVSDEAFAQLVSAGTIQEDTLVWREGMEQWQPLRAVVDAPRPSAAATPAEPSDPPTLSDRCVCCGRPYPRQDLVILSGRLVCELCKPEFVARIREGMPLPQSGRRRARPVNPEALVAEVRARGYTLGVSPILSRAWELYKASFWPSVAVSAIAMILIQAASMIPFIGAFVGIFVQGPILAGMYLFFLKRVREERAEVGDVFWGFNANWWRYLLTVLVMSLPMFALMILVAVPVGFGVALSAGQGGGPPDWVWWVGVPLFLLLFVGAVYLQIAVVFAVPLCADLELGPVQSVLTSFRVVNLRLGSMILLCLALGALMIAGILALLIGVFFVLPLYWYAIALAYEEVFAPRATPGTGPFGGPLAT